MINRSNIKWIILVLTVLICIFVYNDKSDDVVKDDYSVDTVASTNVISNGDDFFSEFRIKRSKLYDEEISGLKDIIDNSNTSDEVRSSSQLDLLALYSKKKIEFKVEEILIGRGYEDVIFCYDDSSPILIIKVDKILSDEEVLLENFVKIIANIDTANISIFNMQ